MDQKETSLPSSAKDADPSQEHNDKTTHTDDRSNGSVCASSDLDASEKRPMSPGTLALMCDEQDTMFLTAPSPNGLTATGGGNSLSQLSQGKGITEVYREQERLVLTTVRDCFNKLITVGEIKESKCLSSARAELGGQEDPLNNRNQKNNCMSNSLPVPPAAKPTHTDVSVLSPTCTDIAKISGIPENGDVQLKVEK